ncbi:MAG: hypothetical protein RIS35_2727, partial [Pseudomonadota bacterium]
ASTLETVPAARLAPGDLLRLPVGARIPVDATIVGGATAIDQSLLTGESIPVPRQPGDEVPGGAINAGSPVWLRVTRASGDSTLSTIERLIERAALEKPALARLADRVASGFVIALLGFAAIVLLAWSQIDPDRALPIAIAVLVVSCPCALSLATPAALAAATGAATRNGALVASGVALETIAGCTDVVFDKTGTLTEGRPGLARIDRLDDAVDEATVLSLAAGLETGSPHPLAKAIVDAAHARGLTPPPAVGLLACAGLGVEGTIGERALRIGSAAFVGEWSTLPELPRAAGSEGSARPPQASFTPSGGGLGEAQPWGRSEAGAGPPQACFTPSGGGLGEAQPWGRSEVWLVERGRPIARFELLDTLRAEARETVDLLHAKGLAVHLLSGDHAAAVDACARTLGIPSARAQASPADKLDYVRELQAKGRRVLMVGDGVNDAPVLAAADASLAVGHATALAKTAADAVLLSSDITMVSRLIGLARQTRRIIVENLWWATAYNLIAIPAAAMGWVPPWLAAIGMSGSSLLVVGNALRLRIASPRALHSK